MQRTYGLPVNYDDGQWCWQTYYGNDGARRLNEPTLEPLREELRSHYMARRVPSALQKADRQLAQARFKNRFHWTSQGTRLGRLTCHNTKKGGDESLKL